jgi:hypothetical protein
MPPEVRRKLINIQEHIYRGERHTTSATEAESMWFMGARCDDSGKDFFIASYVEKNTAAR